MENSDYNKKVYAFIDASNLFLWWRERFGLENRLSQTFSLFEKKIQGSQIFVFGGVEK